MREGRSKIYRIWRDVVRVKTVPNPNTTERKTPPYGKKYPPIHVEHLECGHVHDINNAAVPAKQRICNWCEFLCDDGGIREYRDYSGTVEMRVETWNPETGMPKILKDQRAVTRRVKNRRRSDKIAAFHAL